jgi:ubiquinone/menaquinone biosynthesis C-methylase UbiE
MTTSRSVRLDPAAFDRFEASGWDRKASAYRDFWAPITARAGSALLDAVELRPGDRVIDIGSGTGNLARQAADRGARPIGVDVAPSMTALASTLHPDLSFADGSADRLPFEDGQFDVALLGFVLLHVGRPRDVLREARRVLAAGGRFGMTLWDEGDVNALHAAILSSVAEVGAEPPADLPPGPPGFYADADLVALLESAGFRDVRVTHVAFSVAFANASTMWDGILRAGVRFPPLVQAQTPAIRARIRTAFDRYVGRFATADGSLAVPTSIQVTAGRR